ncbi:MAG: hypothetical protein NC400_06170 [Clostridium sp.]|nr:hypothetical protein [Clostridium sp.]
MKRIIKAAILITAAFLVFPIFESQSGIDTVKAEEYQSPALSDSGTQSSRPVNQTPAKKPKASQNVQAVEEPAPVYTHQHSFSTVIIQDASETQDAVAQLQCSCGQTNGTFSLGGSSQGLFIKNVLNDIENAPADGVVTVDTEVWTCYNKKVMEALLERPDVTLVTNYRYNHVDYTVTIPAGYDTSTLLDENGYCRFRYLDQVLGGSEVSTK